MRFIKKIVHKVESKNLYFWSFCIFLFSIVSFFSYGFIKDLYFWYEDYKYMTLFYVGGPRQWPFEGDLIILSPFFRLFSDNPAGYFVSALVLYIFLSLAAAFFIYSFTKSRLLAIISGLILSSGYIGSENIQMMSTAIPRNLYLTLALLALIFYRYSYIKNSVKYWLLSLIIYIFLIALVAARAHTLIFLFFLTDIYLLLTSKIFQKEKKSLLVPFKFIFKRLSIFFVLTIVVYSLFSNGYDKQAMVGAFGFSLERINFAANMNFFSAMGSFLFPSGLFDLLPINADQSLFLTSFLGFLLIVVFLGLGLFSKDKGFGKLLIFLTFSWIASYIIYHWKDYNYLHFSWSRYLFLGFPFFAMIIALIVNKKFFQSKLLVIKFLGVFLLFLIISSNLFFGYTSRMRNFRLERSFYLQKFLVSLKKHAPQLKGSTLFYFDAAYDPRISSIFNSFFACGYCSQQWSLAFFYHQNPDNITIARDYDEFVSEYKSGKYKNAYSFFYSENRELIDLTKLVTSATSSLSSLEVENDKISYISENPDTEDIKTGLVIDTSSFPSYRPVKVDINMVFDAFGNDKNIYPYPFKTPIVSNLTDNKNKTESLLNYIIERNNFKKYVKIKTSKSLDKQYIAEASIDSNLDTSWIANKQDFFNSKSSWIALSLPEKSEIAEIRWLSSYKYRLPVDYDYQISNNEDGPWNTVLSVRGRKVDVQKYVTDKLPKATFQYLRMVIYKTSFDSPAITEIEMIKNPLALSSDDAEFFLDYPITGVSNRNEAEEIVNTLKDYQKIKIYPLTDRFQGKNQISPLVMPIELDGEDHSYSFIVPASGTSLNKIIIEFPRIPLSANITSASLSLLPL